MATMTTTTPTMVINVADDVDGDHKNNERGNDGDDGDEVHEGDGDDIDDGNDQARHPHHRRPQLRLRNGCRGQRTPEHWGSAWGQQPRAATCSRRAEMYTVPGPCPTDAHHRNPTMLVLAAKRAHVAEWRRTTQPKTVHTGSGCAGPMYLRRHLERLEELWPIGNSGQCDKCGRHLKFQPHVLLDESAEKSISSANDSHVPAPLSSNTYSCNQNPSSHP